MTGEAGRARPCSWWPGAWATAGPATSWPTCASTTTPTRWPNSAGCSTCTRSTSTRPDPADLLSLEGEVAEEVRARLAALGHRGDPTPVGLDAALADWAGIENLEERMVAGQIDPLVLAHLRRLG